MAGESREVKKLGEKTLSESGTGGTERGRDWGMEGATEGERRSDLISLGCMTLS